MKEKLYTIEDAPQELLFAILLYEMFLKWGYTKNEVKIRITDIVNVVLIDGKHVIGFTAGICTLPKKEMEACTEFLIAVWEHSSIKKEEKHRVRDRFYSRLREFRFEVGNTLDDARLYRRRMHEEPPSTKYH